MAPCPGGGPARRPNFIRCKRCTAVQPKSMQFLSPFSISASEKTHVSTARRLAGSHRSCQGLIRGVRGRSCRVAELPSCRVTRHASVMSVTSTSVTSVGRCGPTITGPGAGELEPGTVLHTATIFVGPGAFFERGAGLPANLLEKEDTPTASASTRPWAGLVPLVSVSVWSPSKPA